MTHVYFRRYENKSRLPRSIVYRNEIMLGYTEDLMIRSRYRIIHYELFDSIVINRNNDTLIDDRNLFYYCIGKKATNSQ